MKRTRSIRRSCYGLSPASNPRTAYQQLGELHPAGIEAVRLRKNLLDATLTVDSEASPEYLDQLDVKDGQILSIVPF